VEGDGKGLAEIRRRSERILIPRMGPVAEGFAACLRGIGVPAESLPMPDRESVRLGRRHTSGKECLPLCVTLGTLLQRLESDRGTGERFAFLMPTANGPCRFGAYNVLHRIVLDRLGWADRVRLWSPSDTGYFDGLPPGFSIFAFSAFMGTDLLEAARFDARPSETRPGAADAVYHRYQQDLIELLERAGRNLTAGGALRQVLTRKLFGVADLLAQASASFAAIREDRAMPVVLVVGEIYVRCDPFSNDFVIERLESRGIRCRLSPFNEWIEYTDHINRYRDRTWGFGKQLSRFVRRRIQDAAYGAMASGLGWPARVTVEQSLRAAAPYVRMALEGEAAMTVGAALHEWREGLVDGVVSVGPLECMPNKIAEAQLFHAAEREGLQSITLPMNGDPVDPEVLDRFAFEVQTRFRERKEAATAAGRGPARRPAGAHPHPASQTPAALSKSE
jgi:predicted nucleotide-binding protein (sugar kinase/HSP70/actin superfamily)